MVKAQYVRHQPVRAKAEDEYDFARTQENMEDFVSDVYDKGPILDGRLIEDVSLSAYQNKDIEHGLDRRYRGWLVAREHDPTFCDVRAYVDTPQSIPSATDTDVIFDVQSYDTVGDCYNPATGIVTIPHTGYYDVHTWVTLTNLPDTRFSNLALWDASSVYARSGRMNQGATGYFTNVIAARIRINKGELIRVKIYHSNPGALNTTVGSWSNFYIRAVDELTELVSPDETKFLRLLSSKDRKVNLWVF